MKTPPKTQKMFWKGMRELWTGCLLLTINFFFGIFVWMPFDLSPNEALFVITFVFAYYQLRDGFRDLNKVKKKR